MNVNHSDERTAVFLRLPYTIQYTGGWVGTPEAVDHNNNMYEGAVYIWATVEEDSPPNPTRPFLPNINFATSYFGASFLQLPLRLRLTLMLLSALIV